MISVQKLGRVLLFAVLVTSIAVPMVTQAQDGFSYTVDDLVLIQPLDGSPPGTSTPILPGVGTFLAYFNRSVDWLFRVAVGFTVIWMLVGGVMYMVSGNNQSLRGDAIQKMTWSMLGLLLLMFAGFILRTLNSIFFVP